MPAKNHKLVQQIGEAFATGNKLLIFGNGGSAAEASHFAAEFIGIGLPAIALTDPAVLTALANDYGYFHVFSRQLRALGKAGDIAIGISSSGNSENINHALSIAGDLGLVAIDFPRVGTSTSDVQNNQLKLIHEIYEAFL